MKSVDTQFLQALPYFQGLSLDEVAWVGSQVHQRSYGAEELICLAGQRPEALYAVRRGRVRILEISAEGKEQVLFVVDRGGTFNDSAVFDGGPNLASAQALESGASLYVLPLPVIRHLVATNPRVAAAALRIMADRVRILAGLAEDLSLRRLSQRVVKLLLRESESTGVVMLTKREIGARVGTVREVVSRELHHLEEEGAIIRGHEGMVRVNRRVLSALVDDPVVEVAALEDRLPCLAAS